MFRARFHDINSCRLDAGMTKQVGQLRDIFFDVVNVRKWCRSCAGTLTAPLLWPVHTGPCCFQTRGRGVFRGRTLPVESGVCGTFCSPSSFGTGDAAFSLQRILSLRLRTAWLNCNSDTRCRSSRLSRAAVGCACCQWRGRRRAGGNTQHGKARGPGRQRSCADTLMAWPCPPGCRCSLGSR